MHKQFKGFTRRNKSILRPPTTQEDYVYKDVNKAIAELKEKEDKEKTDTEMLDWLIFHSAIVVHSNDGDWCFVKWCDSDYDDRRTEKYYDSREAIQAAMNMKG